MKEVKKPRISKSSKPKKINVKIAPGNWKRIEQYITDFNENPGRTSSKLKYTNVINDALAAYFPGNSD